MLTRSRLWAVGVVIGILTLLVLGMESDMRSIPPSFGARCTQAYDDIWDQASPPKNPPPPARSGRGSGDQLDQESLESFGLDELSSRVGFNHTIPRDPEEWARRLGAGWYIDWYVQRRHPTQKPEHWQMVRLGRGCISPQQDAIRWLASRYPGSVWIIGNEPDNVWQDNVPPEGYAQAYHELYGLIKKADPDAAVAVGGVTQATPLRLAYLDRVLTTYETIYGESMPVDWWTVHGFVLREERGGWGAEIPPGFPSTDSGVLYEPSDSGSLEHFKVQIIDFRTWMAERGYQDTPLAITEFGILMPDTFGFTPEVVVEYLVDTFSWLDQASDDHIGYPQDQNHLVQRWAWFSLYDKLYYTSNLVHIKDDALTDIGWAFRTFVEERSP